MRKGVRMRTLQIRSGVIEYTEAGSGPGVLVIHGAGTAGRAWAERLSPLARNFT